MNDKKLRRVYRELVGGDSAQMYTEAMRMCLHHGSGDIDRDIREIEHIAEIRMIDLDEPC